ncbi:MAG: hypothetical protein JJU19_04815 [Pararhodobacter sp.]|nr:hypothetical protein [Pararhodobacter sp.]
MGFPIILTGLAVLLAAAVVMPGSPLPEELLLLAGLLGAVGVVWVLLARPRGRRYIVLDGSNLLHWQDNQPHLATVRAVVDAVQAQGYRPVVWFDANAGYLIGDRWLGPPELSRALGLPARQVFVAPKGTPADPLLLEGARRLGARVVTNDRFRDWREHYPWLAEPGFLIRGRVQDGAASLSLDAGQARSRRAA